MIRIGLIAILLLGFVNPTRASERLVVHEWGTFTSLQDKQGNALGRINTDDEPVPAFVHQMPYTSLFPPTTAFTSDDKGIPAGDTNVTMRLETPVIYFHLPKDQTGSLSLNIDVAFRGGWLTQYFPDAQAKVDGVENDQLRPPLSPKTVGRLSWRDVVLNSDQGIQPKTDDRVWTSPRDVNAAAVSAGNEREQFLFYRGVGHVDAPLRVVRSSDGKMLDVSAASEGLKIQQAWLVDIRADGADAFRAVPDLSASTNTILAAEFLDDAYSRENLSELRASIHDALVANGLFSDEADALLNTWERSYFQNPGERLFFMVPQSWTDAVLPLKLSVPADINRVMVGRIELVTPAQRALLRQMASASLSNWKELKDAAAAMNKLRSDPTKSAEYNALAGGHGRLEALGVKVPPVYADFLALGRFRTALLLNAKDDSHKLTLFASALVP